MNCFAPVSIAGLDAHALRTPMTVLMQLVRDWPADCAYLH